MKRWILIIVLLTTPGLVIAQAAGDKLSEPSQVNPQRPSVYLEYVCQENEKVRLRLNNNTIWSLAVRAEELYYFTKKEVRLSNGSIFYALPNDRMVSLLFRVDRFALPSKTVKIPASPPQDSFSTNWIASDDMALFSVPIRFLKKDLLVYVVFNYEWELTKHGTFAKGPEHRITFRGIDLPDEKVVCKRR